MLQPTGNTGACQPIQPQGPPGNIRKGNTPKQVLQSRCRASPLGEETRETTKHCNREAESEHVSRDKKSKLRGSLRPGLMGNGCRGQLSFEVAFKGLSSLAAISCSCNECVPRLTMPGSACKPSRIREPGVVD